MFTESEIFLDYKEETLHIDHVDIVVSSHRRAVAMCSIVVVELKRTRWLWFDVQLGDDADSN